MSEATPVIVAYLRGQLQACHEAIAYLWAVVNEHDVTDLQRAANIDQAVHRAFELLPDEMRDNVPLVGETYWYHPESDCYFSLEDGAEHPAYRGGADGAMCQQISKERYEAATAPGGFEDLGI